jgi:hypothetical protein
VPLNVIQRQLGHANLGTTSIYLQGIDTEEIIATVHARRAPMMSAHCRTPSLIKPSANSGSVQTLPLDAHLGHRFADQRERHEESPRPAHRPRTSS